MYVIYKYEYYILFFFFSSRRRHTRLQGDWSSDVCSSDLPEIFRADDPAGAVELPAENRKPLIQLVTGLPVEVFTAGDSLGWCYQFWQAERKDEVNAAGNKISADELPAVTQLFT